MQYNILGKSGLVVSRLSFGAMTFGQGVLVGDLSTHIDQATADKMVGMAMDAGINLFDTADMYTSGQSETILGKALKSRRGDAIIATKCGFRTSDGLLSAGLSYRQLIRCVEASLKRLDTDYIDLFQLHIPDPVTPLEETLRALDYVTQKGYVRYAGYCNYPAWQGQKMLGIQEKRGYAAMVSAQMYYSLIGRDIEMDVVPFLEDAGLGLLVWSPLASGFLSGKYTSEHPVPEGSRRSKFNFPPVDLVKGYETVSKLAEIAARRNTTTARVAIAWLLSKRYVSSVIIGSNSLDQLEENLSSVNVKLTGDEVAELEKVAPAQSSYPAWMQPMGWDGKTKAALGK